MMTHCDPNAGRRLLEGDLPERDELEFVRHLEGCERCRNQLEKEAGDQQIWRAARKLLGESPEIVHWEAETHLLDVPDTATAGRGLDLTFLAPTDDSAFIGRIGGYEVRGVIGRGGMGVVFKASDRSLNRNVAVKVLEPSLASIGAARQRFAREARAMAAISHEHVVPIYCVDEHQGLPYFAMEYVAGGTLESRLRLHGPLDVISTVRIAVQVSAALSAAHESGLVHRDIKPANILLDPGIDRVRVADFGLARIANDASYTRSGLLAGTPQFMAPEQVRGEACDARSDLFSLGSVVYAMCTGHPPFRAETVYGVMQRIVHDRPRPVREQAPHVPVWLEHFVDRLLSKKHEDRFESAADVVRLLEPELLYLQRPESSPLVSRPWIKVGEPMKRPRRRLAGLIFAVAITFMIGCIGVAAVFWRPLTHQDQAGASTVGASAVGASAVDVPLWNSDGWDEVMQQAAQMETDLLRDSSRATYDPWSDDLRRLQRRLAEVDAELP